MGQAHFGTACPAAAGQADKNALLRKHFLFIGKKSVLPFFFKLRMYLVFCEYS